MSLRARLGVGAHANETNETQCVSFCCCRQTHSRWRIMSKSGTNTAAYHPCTRRILLEKDISNLSWISGVFQGLLTDIWFTSRVKVLQSQGSIPSSKVIEEAKFITLVVCARLNWIPFEHGVIPHAPQPSSHLQVKKVTAKSGPIWRRRLS